MSSDQYVIKKSAKLRRWRNIEEALGFFFISLLSISILVSIYEYAYLKPVWMAVSTVLFAILLPMPSLLVISCYMQRLTNEKIIQFLSENQKPKRQLAEKHA